jgi:hypothetical protein
MADPRAQVETSVNHSSPSAVVQVPCTPGKNGEGNANDSGYGSQVSTGNTTPSTAPGDTLPLPDHPGAPRTTSRAKLASKLFGRKLKVSPMLNAKVDEPSRKAFEAIKPRFERLLVEHIRQTQKPGDQYKPMSTRLIMMGTSMDSASAHIVVLCQPEQKDTVQRFVKSCNIRQLCEGANPGVTPLKVAVLGQAPRLRVDVRVLKDALQDQAPAGGRTTLCGTPIRLRHILGEQRNATFGGFVKVLTRDGHIRVYGLTAGHVFQSFSGETEDIPGGTEESLETSLSRARLHAQAGLCDTADEEEEVEDASDTEFDFCIEETQTQSIPTDEPWNFKEPIHIGSVIYPLASTIRANYDWALFETSDYEANKVPTEPKAVLRLSHATPGATGNQPRPIYMISASSGVQEGLLLPEIGSILIGTGETFVDAYMVTLDGRPGM